MKERLLSILCTLLMSLGVQAHNLEPLHVDGRYLKNSKGDIVTLHGYMAVLDPGFQAEEYKWDGYDVAACLKNKKAATDRLLASGWKMDYVRFGLDAYWFSDDYNDQVGSFNLNRFKKYFEELFLPLIEYYHEKGIYTLLWPQQGTTELIELGDKTQEQLLLMWDYVSSHPRIRNNPGVMFELENEPLGIKCHQGDSYDPYWGFVFNNTSAFREFRDYWQPIVDKIRSHCDNIIYIPGLQLESDHAGFSNYPIEGENIGYAVHWYPGWWGNMRKDWEDHVFPIAYKAPIIITENAWAPYSNYLYGNSETSTSNFGKPLKDIVDELGNVSWNCYEPEEDYYYLVNSLSSSEKAIIANDPEACFKAMYQWWDDYSKTKVMPTSQLKAKNVAFENFPTVLAPGQKALANIKAEFTNGMTWDVSGDAEYTIADESVLRIMNGVIWALKEGTTTITAKYTDGTGQAFSHEFKVTNTLFPLTKEGFVLDWFSLDAGGSFDEATGTFSSGGPGSGGWDFEGGMDFSSYKYLVVQLNQEQHCWTTVHIFDNANLSDENSAWNDDTKDVGFNFNDKTELVIDLQSLHKQNGEPLDLSHIYRVDIWINGAEGSVSIKRVFLSNDGITAAYQEPTRVYADHKAIYYGDDVPTLTYTVSGPRINGTPTLSTTANSASSVGTYPITIGRGSVTNGQASFIDGELTIFKAPLTVGVQDVTITEGDDIPNFTLTYDGLRNNDNESNAFTTKPTAKTAATSASKPGTYPITVSGGEAMNYVLTYTQGTLTIQKKAEEPVTITADNKTMVYGDDVPTLTYKSEGAKLNGTPQLSTTATKTSPVGTYPIKVEKGTVTNEQVTYVDGTLTITQAPLTVGVQDVTIYEGEDIPTFILTYDGWRNNDSEATAFTKKPTAKTTATSASKPGTYPITVSGGSAKNYALTYTQGTLTIKENGSTSPWTSLVLNGDLESDDVSCFYSREDAAKNDKIVPATIVDGAGKNNSHGIVIHSTENPPESWNTQFFIRLTQPLPAGTKYRMSLDYKASQNADVPMECHAEPSDYIHWDFGSLTFTKSWKHYEKEGTITGEQSTAEKKMHTIAFNLANVATATTYYFDNIVFEIDQTTDIKVMSANNQSKMVIYNLGGQRLSKPQKGINIINGKKVFKK